ncbi:MAG: OmpH family outer membrane protein [Bacteroides sp.]|nr:OmpH family outer membrane protein [Ruminococcus flavefaciens]MCM1555732.1 OmpH family outer membrane protein [Bacteroides sp.]
MKKILLAAAVAAALVFCGNRACAQGKIGHINAMELIQQMPEADSVQNALQAYAKDLQDNIATMQTEVQNKYAEYQNNQSQWSELIKQTKAKEIQDMQVRLQEFSAQAEEDYQQKTQELLAPLSDKVKAAIEAVAREGKFAYILDSGNSTVFFGSEAIDVTSLVKKKLGLPDVPVSKALPR